jgi:SOS-response transcriptional repressor LexA
MFVICSVKDTMRKEKKTMAKKVTGFANQADEEAGEMLTLSQLLTVNMTAARLYRMQGNAMEWIGIHHGDMLLVECTNKWTTGDIVIAEMDGEQLVRTVRKDREGKWYLEAATEGISPLYPQKELRIIAVVKRCIKCYE